MASAWPELPSAKLAGARDGVEALAFCGTETQVTYEQGRRLRSAPFLLGLGVATAKDILETVFLRNGGIWRLIMPNPDKPLSADTPKNPTDNNLVIGLVLAGVVAFLILAGAMFFNSDEKSADATTTPPSTESPVPD